jgi:hypothetical protein
VTSSTEGSNCEPWLRGGLQEIVVKPWGCTYHGQLRARGIPEDALREIESRLRGGYIDVL